MGGAKRRPLKRCRIVLSDDEEEEEDGDDSHGELPSVAAALTGEHRHSNTKYSLCYHSNAVAFRSYIMYIIIYMCVLYVDWDTPCIAQFH